MHIPGVLGGYDCRIRKVMVVIQPEQGVGDTVSPVHNDIHSREA